MDSYKNKTVEKGSFRKFFDELFDIKSNTVYVFFMACCCIIHAIFLTVFAVLNIYPMMIFNMVSVVLYAILSIRTKKVGRIPPIIPIIGEIAFHGVAATIFTGWNSGFMLYVICIVTLVFYWPTVKRNQATALAFIFTFIFLATKLYCCFFQPIQSDIKINVSQVLYLFNSMFSFFMLTYFSILFKKIIDNKQQMLNEQNKELRKIAGIDPLTGLMNRRSMYEQLHESEKLRSSGSIYSITICDIDNFKRVNDTYGHGCGDDVLKKVAEVISTAAEKSSSVCRWGGEEFLILFNDMGTEKAAEITEYIRRSIEEADFSFESGTPDITMTFGVAGTESFPELGLDLLIAKADERLYNGKKSGKNCVVSR
ncbi:MAG: GGDEF domain-containing protein [Oscillospiraceae bacterium]